MFSHIAEGSLLFVIRPLPGVWSHLLHRTRTTLDELHVIGHVYQELLVCMTQFTYIEFVCIVVSVFTIICTHKYMLK